MAHIADLYNNGKCGLHRTLLQARGAYRELIAKEGRVLEASFQRQQLESLCVRCPNCSSRVSSARCSSCRFFPVPLHEASKSIVDKSCLANIQNPRPSRMARPKSAVVSLQELQGKVSELSHFVIEEKKCQEKLLARVNCLLVQANNL